MSYFHNRFNKVDKTALYQFVRFLEEREDYGDNGVLVPFGWRYGDEFRKLRQIINFAYTHGFRDDNV